MPVPTTLTDKTLAGVGSPYQDSNLVITGVDGSAWNSIANAVVDNADPAQASGLVVVVTPRSRGLVVPFRIAAFPSDAVILGVQVSVKWRVTGGGTSNVKDNFVSLCTGTAFDQIAAIVDLGDDAVGVLQADGQRLFHIDRLAGAEGGHRTVQMMAGRRGHGHHIDGGQESGEVIEARTAMLFGHRPRPLQVRIVDGRQGCARRVGVLARVVAAEHAGSDHPAPQNLRHVTLQSTCAGP